MGPQMTDDAAALAGFNGVARLFPLPNLVLFPQVVQGLHIFEPRYRQMTADALAGDGLITLVLLKGGWEDDYDKTPAVEDVACLGRITRHEALPDGRFNLHLRGLARVRLVEELATDKKYRTAKAVAVPDETPADLSALTEMRRKLADAVLGRFDPGGPAFRQLRDLFRGDLPLGALCDVLAYALPVPLATKQGLLAEPRVIERTAAMIRAMAPLPPETAPKPTPKPGRFPPDFSPN